MHLLFFLYFYISQGHCHPSSSPPPRRNALRMYESLGKILRKIQSHKYCRETRPRRQGLKELDNLDKVSGTKVSQNLFLFHLKVKVSKTPADEIVGYVPVTSHLLAGRSHNIRIHNESCHGLKRNGTQVRSRLR